MICIYNGRLLAEERIITGKALLFTDKIHSIINEEDALGHDFKYINANGAFISPGFIDLHIHGYHHADTMDGTSDALTAISTGIAENGVTSFLPTTLSMDFSSIQKALDEIARLINTPLKGAQILGAHLEGPFINPTYKGAHDGRYIVPPASDSLEFIQKYKDVIKLITVAPEIEGCLELVHQLSQTTSITLSMGHTNATYEEAVNGIKKGISHVTHLFNAMSGLHHRHPGTVGAALTSSKVNCELIADGYHVDPVLFPLLVAAKTLDHLVLVTDCMSAGGCPDGEYMLGGQQVYVEYNRARLQDGTLAGSTLKLNKALKHFIQSTHLPLEKVINLVTFNPAKSIHMENIKGSLTPAKDADITLFDDEFQVLSTICKGQTVYSSL